MTNLINISIEHVKDVMKNNDASHDWNHVERVWKLTVAIAKKENYKGDMELLELAAILHDVKDHKYSKEVDPSKLSEELNNSISQLLSPYQYPTDKINKICRIIDEISFKNELGRENPFDILEESKIVQDSDRLDAIGAFGIGRTFAYGTVKSSPFYDISQYPSLNEFKNNKDTKRLTKEEYTQISKSNSPTINHFYDKLFHLINLMKTKTGKEIAIKRQKTMMDFVESFNNELNEVYDTNKFN